MTLLQTKLKTPPLSRSLVVRPRLLDQLDGQRFQRLILLSAPAGFGKTTLARQWLETAGLQAGWVSLDANDDRPGRFMDYFTAGLQQATGLLLRRPPPIGEQAAGSLDAALVTLINQLEDADLPECVLVLDDFQFIRDPLLLEAISYWVDFAPSPITLLLTSRTEPPLPLIRWRVKGYARCLYAADLRFSREEISHYCRRQGLTIEDEGQIDALYLQTTGWPAAVHLALDRYHRRPDDDGIAERKSASAIRPRSIPAGHAVGAIGADAAEYMAAEVLAELPEPLRNFILAIYPLKRFDAALCDTVRESGDSHGFIHALVQRDLFIIALDEAGRWYRLHDLFAEAACCLISMHHLAGPDLRHLADASLAAGLFVEGMELLVEAQDWPGLLTRLEQWGRHLVREGYHLNLLDWLELASGAEARETLELSLLQAWCLVLDNRFEPLIPVVEQISQMLESGIPAGRTAVDAEVQELQLLQTFLLRRDGRFSEAISLTRTVLGGPGSGALPFRSMALFNLGTDLYRSGQLQEAGYQLERGIEAGRNERRFSGVLSNAGLRLWILQVQGRYPEALQCYAAVQAWHLSFFEGHQSPNVLSCWMNAAMVSVMVEMNRLEEAERFLNPMLVFAQSAQPLQRLLTAYVQALYLGARGREIEGLQTLSSLQPMLDGSSLDILTLAPPIEILRQRLSGPGSSLPASLPEAALSGDRSSSADQTAVGGSPPEKTPPAGSRTDQIVFQLESCLLQCEQASHRGDWLTQRLSACELEELAERAPSARYAMLARLYRAWADWRLNDLRSARQLLGATLPECAAMELVRPLRGLAGVLTPLLQQNASLWEKLPTDYLQRAGFDLSVLREALPGLTGEMLSPRELEVLALINEGRPNKVIARELNLSPATVKTHIRNINSKVGAGNRTEALARARRLGLINF